MKSKVKRVFYDVWYSDKDPIKLMVDNQSSTEGTIQNCLNINEYYQTRAKPRFYRYTITAERIYPKVRNKK